MRPAEVAPEERFKRGDTDGNGALQLTDAGYVLLYLFSGGDAPPAPGPGECGPDTGDVDLGCGVYDSCGA